MSVERKRRVPIEDREMAIAKRGNNYLPEEGQGVAEIVAEFRCF